MKPGSKVLYLGAASGTTVSHVADLVGKVMFLQSVLLRFLLSDVLAFSYRKVFEWNQMSVLILGQYEKNEKKLQKCLSYYP